jgi:hypothetical protein
MDFKTNQFTFSCVFRKVLASPNPPSLRRAPSDNEKSKIERSKLTNIYLRAATATSLACVLLIDIQHQLTPI